MDDTIKMDLIEYNSHPIKPARGIRPLVDIYYRLSEQNITENSVRFLLVYKNAVTLEFRLQRVEVMP